VTDQLTGPFIAGLEVPGQKGKGLTFTVGLSIELAVTVHHAAHGMFKPLPHGMFKHGGYYTRSVAGRCEMWKLQFCRISCGLLPHHNRAVFRAAVGMAAGQQQLQGQKQQPEQ